MVEDQDWLRPSLFWAIGEPTPWVGCVSSGLRLRCPHRRVPTLKARPQSLNIADRSRVGGHRHGLLIDGHLKVLKSVRPLNRIMHWALFLFFGIGKRRGRRITVVVVGREYSLWQRRVGRHARVQHAPSCLRTPQELIRQSLFQPKSNLEKVKNVMFSLFLLLRITCWNYIEIETAN